MSDMPLAFVDPRIPDNSDAFVQFWGIPQHSTRDRKMINAQTTLGHQFLRIARREAISQVPTHTQDDDLSVEMASSEQNRSRPLHQAHGIRVGRTPFATDPNKRLDSGIFSN